MDMLNNKWYWNCFIESNFSMIGNALLAQLQFHDSNLMKKRKEEMILSDILTHALEFRSWCEIKIKDVDQTCT